MIEKKATFSLKSIAERKVFGAVLIPDEADSDGDIVSAEKIRQVHDIFNEKYRNIDVQHSLQNVGEIYESYILPNETTFTFESGTETYPAGTWVMGTKIYDDAAWGMVEKGILRGYSIMAISPLLKDSASKAENGRTTLADLNPDWIVNAVSLVDAPAVQRAVWVSIKSATEKMKQSIIDKLSLNKDEEVVKMDPQLEQQIQDMLAQLLEPVIAKFNELEQKVTELENKQPKDKQPKDKQPKDKQPQQPQDQKQPQDPNAPQKPMKSEEDVVSEEVVKDEVTVALDEVEKDVEEAPVEDAEKSEVPTVEDLMAKIAELEKKVSTKAAPKRLYGQDGLENTQITEIANDRDAFGRKIKR